MRILIVSNLKAKGYGESTRPSFLGNGLVESGHTILHVCDSAGESRQNVRYISKAPFGTSNSIVTRILNFITVFVSTRLFRPDIIYVQQLNNWNWVRETRTLPKALRVYDAHTSAYLEAEAFGEPADVLKVVHMREQQALTEPDHIITVSNETRDFFLSNFDVAAEKISLVKNATSLTPVPELTNSSGDKFNCVSILPLDGFPSNDMAMEMLLDIAAFTESKDSEIVFTVIGGGSHPDPRSANVHYTGYVEDLEQEVLNADLCLVSYPEGAVCGGPRNKVCDFFALGQCVVSTKEGMRGFDDCQPDVHYALGDSVEEFSNAILDLKSDAVKRQRIRSAALEKGAQYQWPIRAKEVNAIFEGLI